VYLLQSAGTSGALEVEPNERVYLLPTPDDSLVLEVPAHQRAFALPGSATRLALEIPSGQRPTGALEVPAQQRVQLLPRAAENAILEIAAAQRVYTLSGSRSDALEAPATQRRYLLIAAGVTSNALEVEPSQRLYAMPAAQIAAGGETRTRWFGFDVSSITIMAFLTFAGMVIGWVFGRRAGGIPRRPSHALGK
jgi:hypothetical protein